MNEVTVEALERLRDALSMADWHLWNVMRHYQQAGLSDLYASLSPLLKQAEKTTAHRIRELEIEEREHGLQSR